MLRGVWTVLATGFTLGVIGLSMAMNFAFGYGLGTTEANARILAALSVACDGLKALLPLFVAWQWAEGRRLAAFAGTILFALLLAYGTASAIGFAAENRAVLTGGRESRNAALADSATGLAAAEARLAALPSHRLLGVIASDIAVRRKDRVWDATQGCTEATLPASRDFCKRVEELNGELAIAAEAAALTLRIDQLKRTIADSRQAGAGREADPQARAITHLTGIDPSHVRAALTWLLAIAVEAISAFGLFAILSRRARRAPDTARQTATAPLMHPWRRAEVERMAPAVGWRLSKAG